MNYSQARRPQSRDGSARAGAVAQRDGVGAERDPRRAYNADGTVIPPRDLANMQENGVRSVEATLRVLANVWMRDLLGVCDDLECSGKELGIGRLGERVGQLGFRRQVLAKHRVR